MKKLEIFTINTLKFEASEIMHFIIIRLLCIFFVDFSDFGNFYHILKS